MTNEHLDKDARNKLADIDARVARRFREMFSKGGFTLEDVERGFKKWREELDNGPGRVYPPHKHRPGLRYLEVGDTVETQSHGMLGRVVRILPGYSGRVLVLWDNGDYSEHPTGKLKRVDKKPEYITMIIEGDHVRDMRNDRIGLVKTIHPSSNTATVVWRNGTTLPVSLTWLCPMSGTLGPAVFKTGRRVVSKINNQTGTIKVEVGTSEGAPRKWGVCWDGMAHNDSVTVPETELRLIGSDRGRSDQDSVYNLLQRQIDTLSRRVGSLEKNS